MLLSGMEYPTSHKSRFMLLYLFNVFISHVMSPKEDLLITIMEICTVNVKSGLNIWLDFENAFTSPQPP